MGKKLVIDTMFCDLRKMQESTLAQYDSIKISVLCTPGSSFGPAGEGYVRFALTMPAERIAQAVQAIADSGILN